MVNILTRQIKPRKKAMKISHTRRAGRIEDVDWHDWKQNSPSYLDILVLWTRSSNNLVSSSKCLVEMKPHGNSKHLVGGDLGASFYLFDTSYQETIS
jgi:hypothetical protein